MNNWRIGKQTNKNTKRQTINLNDQLIKKNKQKQNKIIPMTSS